MGNVQTAGPHEVLILSGGCCGSGNKQTIIGGWGWAWWMLTNVQRLSLGIITLLPTCEDVETLEGVPVTATGVAQVKVMQDKGCLDAAIEQFLGKDVNDIKSTVLATLEGHLRAILGTLSVESIYRDRDSFAELVLKVAAPDVGRMGIEILSFTIKDLFDNVQYLDSLGRTQTANVKRDADIGVAEAERDAGLQEAECQRLLNDKKCEADGAIADSKRKFELLNTEYQHQVNIAKAEAELAHQLQSAKEQQFIKNEEIEIQVIERKQQIKIEDLEIQCNEKKMDSTVRLPAKAEVFKMEQLAKGNRTKKVLGAEAEAEGILLNGKADAAIFAAKGDAEADGLLRMSQAYGNFTDAAMLNSIMTILPSISAEVLAPLKKVEEIVITNGICDSTDLNELKANFINMFNSLPDSVRVAAEVELSKMMGRTSGLVGTA